MEKVTTADLMDDLRTVVQDTEVLLRATEGQIGEKADDARRRVQAALASARTPAQGDAGLGRRGGRRSGQGHRGLCP
jgi:ElaB/YqjD/DUF883 family membrane-anchored ribosome-binding protein